MVSAINCSSLERSAQDTFRMTLSYLESKDILSVLQTSSSLHQYVKDPMAIRHFVNSEANREWCQLRMESICPGRGKYPSIAHLKKIYNARRAYFLQQGFLPREIPKFSINPKKFWERDLKLEQEIGNIRNTGLFSDQMQERDVAINENLKSVCMGVCFIIFSTVYAMFIASNFYDRVIFFVLKYLILKINQKLNANHRFLNYLIIWCQLELEIALVMSIRGISIGKAIAVVCLAEFAMYATIVVIVVVVALIIGGLVRYGIPLNNIVTFDRANNRIQFSAEVINLCAKIPNFWSRNIRKAQSCFYANMEKMHTKFLEVKKFPSTIWIRFSS